MKRYIFVWTALFLVILFFYKDAFKSFFEGDEWFYFSIYLPLTSHPNGIIEAFLKSFTEANSISGGGHVTPLYNIFWFLENKFFGLHFKYYIFLSILLHTTNSFLLYFLMLKQIGKKGISFLAGVIFAISSVHYEAITWVMAVVPTQISLLFTLGGLILYVMWGKNVKKNKKLLITSLVLFLAGIFTKETVICVVLLAPILLLSKGKNIFIRGIIQSILVLVIYLPIRFGIPVLIGQASVSVSTIPIKSLILYQILLIERMITEVFVSSNVLLVWSRFLSNNMYLHMPSSLVHVETVELFSQTIGADILLLFLSPIFVTICFVVLRQVYFQKRYYETLLFSVVHIITSAIPLLFILNYAPWWINGAFIDSRHLYLPSLGAAILLAFGFTYISKIIQKSKFKILLICMLLLFSLFWLISQYKIIQQQTAKFEGLARMRQVLLSSEQKYLPVLPKKAVILIESDTPYFGFGPIPPFQTNLGQVLAVMYYQKNQLPEVFLTKSQYMKKGILGEGVVTDGKRTFGYYLHKENLLKDLKENKFTIDDVYGFYWHGADNTLEDRITNTRDEAKQYIETISHTNSWNHVEIPEWVKFSYPNGSSITDEIPNDENVMKMYEVAFSNNLPIQISLKTKNEKMPFHDYLRLEKKSVDIPNNAEYKILNVYRNDGSPVTSVFITSGEFKRYLIPFGNGKGYLEFSRRIESSVINNSDIYRDQDIELLISTVYF